MRDTPLDGYVAGFVARSAAMRGPGRPAATGTGIHGVLAGPDDPRVRLLVTDDRARDALAGLLPGVRAGTITVLADAARCVDLLAGRPGWTPEEVTPMVCRDLSAVPAVPPPDGLRVLPVRRDDGDPAGVALGDAVALEDAVALAARADPAVVDPPEVLARYLRSLPREIALLAAVDGDGAVRATSGAGAFGDHASVLFVNTDHGRRGRGIGRSMTAAALRGARQAGARRAALDASAAGAGIYRRLGFQAAGRATTFARSG